MATSNVVNHAASVTGVALRICRLATDGTPLQGATGTVYVTRAFMRVSFTPEYEEGDEVTEKNAAGEVCVTSKAPDTLKRANIELAICEPDPEITELLTGGVLLTASGDTDPAMAGKVVGYATQKVGEAPNEDGVGIEVWSQAINNGARDNTLPYWRWVFPKAMLRPSGDRVIENGLLANAFEGYSVGNLNFGTGPTDDWAWPDATDRPFLYARDTEIPWDGSNGWVDNTPYVADPGESPGDIVAGSDAGPMYADTYAAEDTLATGPTLVP
jgi:hypothetical protein